MSANNVRGLTEGQEPRRERNRKRLLKRSIGLFKKTSGKRNSQAGDKPEIVTETVDTYVFYLAGKYCIYSCTCVILETNKQTHKHKDSLALQKG